MEKTKAVKNMETIKKNIKKWKSDEIYYADIIDNANMTCIILFRQKKKEG